MFMSKSECSLKYLVFLYPLLILTLFYHRSSAYYFVFSGQFIFHYTRWWSLHVSITFLWWVISFSAQVVLAVDTESFRIIFQSILCIEFHGLSVLARFLHKIFTFIYILHLGLCMLYLNFVVHFSYYLP